MVEEDFFTNDDDDYEDYDDLGVIDVSIKREAYAKLYFIRCYEDNCVVYAFKKGRIGYYIHETIAEEDFFTNDNDDYEDYDDLEVIDVSTK